MVTVFRQFWLDEAGTQPCEPSEAWYISEDIRLDDGSIIRQKAIQFKQPRHQKFFYDSSGALCSGSVEENIRFRELMSRHGLETG